MKRLLLAAAAAVGSVALAAPAFAAPPLGISSVRISGDTDTALVRAVCPVDPPTTAFITTEGVLIGSVSIDCTRRRQRFVIPLDVDVLSGGTLQEVSVTISGDSGEVSAFYDQLAVR